MAEKPLNLSYTVPAGSLPDLGEGVSAPIAVRVTDARGVDPRLVMDKIRLSGGIPRGSYFADEPVADAVARTVEQAFQVMGYRLGAEGPVLTGTLNRLDFQVAMGFQRCMLRGGVSVSFVLKDREGGTVLWEETLTGAGSAGTGPLAEDAFKMALGELTSKLAMASGLHEALRS